MFMNTSRSPEYAYVYIYIYICIDLHIHLHMSLHTCSAAKNNFLQKNKSACAHVSIYIDLHIHIRMYSHTCSVSKYSGVCGLRRRCQIPLSTFSNILYKCITHLYLPFLIYFIYVSLLYTCYNVLDMCIHIVLLRNTMELVQTDSVKRDLETGLLMCKRDPLTTAALPYSAAA